MSCKYLENKNCGLNVKKPVKCKKEKCLYWKEWPKNEVIIEDKLYAR